MGNLRGLGDDATARRPNLCAHQIRSPRSKLLRAAAAPSQLVCRPASRLANLQSQGISFLVVGLTGPAAYAPIAAMLVVFAPLRIAGTALANSIQPEMVEARHQVAASRRSGRLSDKVYADSWESAGVVYGAAAMALLPFDEVALARGGADLLHRGFLLGWSMLLSLLSVAPRVILEVLMKISC